MVQLTIVSDTGATLCRLNLEPTATVSQLLHQVFLVKPELRALTCTIRNDARGAVFLVASPAAATTQTLQDAQLASPAAVQETLVFSSQANRPDVPAHGSAVRGGSTDAVAARIMELFGSSNSNARAAAPSHAPPQPPVPDEMHIDPALLDPAQAEMQRRLYEYIQQQQIDENLANALEYTPEAFAKVIMLYVPCTINQVPIKAFVDSGAQMSIMNRTTAEKCGLMRLVDKRMRGVAVGVGRQEILGRIHMTPVNLSGMHIPFSFSVIAEQDIDLIIGLDQLKRHQMVIDLKNNCLTIDSVQVPFLSESEIPKRAGIDVEEAEEGGEVVAEGAGAEEDARPCPSTAAPISRPPAAHDEPQRPFPLSPASPAAAAASSLPGAVPAPMQTPATSTSASPVATPVQTEDEVRMLAGVRRGMQVESFMEFTGLLDREQARELLEAADWDPDAAAALYFEE